MISMDPFFIRTVGTTVEAWSGYRIQFGGEERYAWQKVFKAELKEALAGLPIPPGTPFAGYYDTTNMAISDTENSLFTNLRGSMPRAVEALRFEHGIGTPPDPPAPIDLIGGHLHYYRYEVGGQWMKWEPDQTLARWDHIPRRLPGDGSARPVWYALRDANANGLISFSGYKLDPGARFGLSLTLHATGQGPRNAISYSEELVDGTIAAFHDDRYSEELLLAAANRFPGVTKEELRRAFEHPVGPLIGTPAIRATHGRIWISPADERCKLGELTIRKDSTSRWPELSGRLMTIRSIDTTRRHDVG